MSARKSTRKSSSKSPKKGAGSSADTLDPSSLVSSPTPKSGKSAAKRKAPPSPADSGSDIVFLDAPPVTPKRVRMVRQASPVEGGVSEYPTTSLLARLDAAMADLDASPVPGSTKSRGVRHVAIEAPEELTPRQPEAAPKTKAKLSSNASPPVKSIGIESGSVLSSRPIRVKVKTEKARLIEESAALKSLPPAHGGGDLSDAESLPRTPLPVACESRTSWPTGSAGDVSDGDGSDGVAPRRGLPTVDGSDAESEVDELCEDKLSDGGCAESAPLAGSDDGDKSLEGSAASAAHDSEAEPGSENDVMCRSLQDPALYRIYRNLPPLDRLCEVLPFYRNSGGSFPRAVISPLFKALTDTACDSVIKGLLFVHWDCFVNTSRVDPSILKVDGSRMKMAANSSYAVGVMLGVVTECFLVEVGSGGSPNSPYPVHKITIAPFAQEIRRDMSLWGQIFDFQVVSGSVSEQGISFLTRREGADYSRTASPVKKPTKATGRFLTSVSSSLAASHGLGSASGNSFQPSRGFREKVPIYDGRAGRDAPHFLFTQDDFGRLSSLPLYKNGTRDLPPESVVAVGYTLNVYRSENSGALILSSNIQFVILLGLTAVPKHF